MDCQLIIDQIFKELQSERNYGDVAAYIPELKKVSPDKFGVFISTVEGEHNAAGNHQEQFSVQSIAKVFSLSLAFDLLGEKIWRRVGVEPAGTSFNSMVLLEYESGKPRNPFINSGALVVCDILCSELKKPKRDVLAYIRKVAGDEKISYSKSVAKSEKKQGYRNYALANLLKSFGNLENPVEEVLNLYFDLCSIMMNCQELAQSFLFLANQGKLCLTGERILTERKTERVNAIMQSCGFYDEAGEFAYRVGLPGKSGVGGGIVAVKPDEYSIAVWSPNLNKKGNSYRGMRFLERFTAQTEGSIF